MTCANDHLAVERDHLSKTGAMAQRRPGQPKIPDGLRLVFDAAAERLASKVSAKGDGGTATATAWSSVGFRVVLKSGAGRGATGLMRRTVRRPPSTPVS